MNPVATTPAIDIEPDEWQIVHSILQQHLPHCEVWAFGSRAKRESRRYSDLDLAIITAEGLQLSLLAALKEEFSESDLPWKVDVIDWATTSDSFRKVIEASKVVVQKAGRGNEKRGIISPAGALSDTYRSAFEAAVRETGEIDESGR